MICVTVGRTRHQRMIDEHQNLARLGATLVELRLDYIGRTVNLTRLLKERPTPVVVTCRRKIDGGRWERTEEERLMLLRSAIAMNVEYVDLEEDIADLIPRYGKTKRIVSFHDFDETPENLEGIAKDLSASDADVIKIATMANSFMDVVAMLDLIANAKRPTIGISMGDIGTITRVLGPRYGAPFSYCASSSERRIAPGQLTFQQMHFLYRVGTINPATRLFGVIADPIKHSMSPLIHNAAFLAQGINARYIPFRVPPDDLEFFLEWAKRYPVGGLSVTIPHKSAVLPWLTQAESAAQAIGAVNTIVFNGNETTGYNTDYRGALECLAAAISERTGSTDPFRSQTALVLGAGGVSKAIAYGLRQRGAIVVIAARSQQQAEALATPIGARCVPWSARHDITPTLLVNGTPVGMFPEVDESPFDATRLDPTTMVFDTIYNPESTLLIRRAREQGCRTITGIDMFVRQASYQYKLFTGQDAPEDVMRKVLRDEISPVRVSV